MKKVISLFLVSILLAALVIPVSAAEYPRLVDAAGLLSENQYNQLLSQLDSVSTKRRMDVVIITVDSLEGAAPNAYADDFFDYLEYGVGEHRDGILLLISMEERDWAISTHGAGIPAFTDAGQEYITDQITPLLSEGAYYEAFSRFAELCDDFIRQYETGKPYDSGNLPKGDFNFLLTLLICLGIGLVVALIVTGIMRGQLKSVRAQSAAADYMKPGSLQVTEARDLFLYRHVSRRAKPKSNSSGSSTHRSSSGSSHGGSSGKF